MQKDAKGCKKKCQIPISGINKSTIQNFNLRPFLMMNFILIRYSNVLKLGKNQQTLRRTTRLLRTSLVSLDILYRKYIFNIQIYIWLAFELVILEKSNTFYNITYVFSPIIVQFIIFRSLILSFFFVAYQHSIRVRLTNAEN